MLSVVMTPVQFFERRLTRAPNLLNAVLPSVVCLALRAVSNVIVADKAQDALYGPLWAALGVTNMASMPVRWMLVMMGSLTYPALFGLAVLAVLCVDVLTNDSGQSRRLVEFTGLSFLVSQVPRCLFAIAAAWFWVPDEIRLPLQPTQADAFQAITRYQSVLFASGWMSTSRLIALYSMAWLAFLLAVSLRVVSKLSVAATIVAGTLLFALLSGLDLVNFLRG